MSEGMGDLEPVPEEGKAHGGSSKEQRVGWLLRNVDVSAFAALPTCPAKPWSTEWEDAEAAPAAAEDGAATDTTAKVPTYASVDISVRRPVTATSHSTATYVGHTGDILAAHTAWAKESEEGALFTPPAAKPAVRLDDTLGEVAIVSASRPASAAIPTPAAAASGAGAAVAEGALATARALAATLWQTVDEVVALPAVTSALKAAATGVVKARALAGKNAAKISSGAPPPKDAAKDQIESEEDAAAVAAAAREVLAAQGTSVPLHSKLVLIEPDAADSAEALAALLGNVLSQRPSAVALVTGGVISAPSTDAAASLAAVVGSKAGIAALGTASSPLVPPVQPLANA